MSIKIIIYGLLARLAWLVVPIKKRCWVFGSDCGNMYREGSKYLLEYMLRSHPEYDCCFVTRANGVCTELKARGIPCVNNLSLEGILKLASAECVFTTQMTSDILFAFKKKRRRYFYLMHGMPMKVALCVLSKRQRVAGKDRRTFLALIRRAVSRLLYLDYSIMDSEFVSATSDFFKYWMEAEFDNKTPVKVLGMPRNDSLFQPARVMKEKFVDGLDGSFVISYMPTHRRYGKGAASPAPFMNRQDVQEWMRDNHVILLVKNHPTTLLVQGDNYKSYNSDRIHDITDAGIDPMTVVYRSDVVITDYSSVWMDYLLLRRPIVFYIYDDFVHDDVGVYYDIKQENIGHFCYSEDELFNLIKRIKMDYDAMRPDDAVVHKFHKYVDGNSCERYFKEITQDSKHE